MQHAKATVHELLASVDLGSSIAEQDNLLEVARVETSAFGDLYADKVDLIPGTKGSGKSSLYRIFVDFLPNSLLQQKRVVVAHGVQHHGDDVFHAYNDSFEKLDESQFVDFWCVYLVSLANEHFIKNPYYSELLRPVDREIQAFKSACARARIPDFKERKPLREVLGWVLAVLHSWAPTLKFKPPGESGEFEVDLFGVRGNSGGEASAAGQHPHLPSYVHDIKDRLDSILQKTSLSLWLMVDRLDEIFPRRSKLETTALRGLLRTLRIFDSPHIRVKLFLRDDILEQVVSTGEGFTALTHLTARQSDTLRWTEDGILTMVVKRLSANAGLNAYLGIDPERLAASREYQREIFYKVFPPTVGRGSRQSPTLRWIYNHVADGRGVVTPRDIIDLLTKAKQYQQDDCKLEPAAVTDFIIGSAAIKYGLSELSKRKRTTYLEAEFPHHWQHIQKFIGGKAECSEAHLKSLFGSSWSAISDNLISIGVLSREGKAEAGVTYKIPFLYREGLEVTQGSVD
jgi:hypothetical protein